MKAYNGWIFLIGFVVVMASAVACRSSSKAARKPAVAVVRFTEIPQLSHIENTIFITHYLPEQEKMNIRN